MTIAIQSLVYTALAGYAGVSALVAARVFPDIAPQDTVKPYVVWQEVALTQASDLSGSAESSGLNNYLVQVTSWSRKATEARDLDYQVRLAMIAGAGFKSVHRDSRAMGYEADTKLFGSQSDFSLWVKS
jgi:hypothetical protein